MYVLNQIALFLALAGLIGGLAGWFLRRSFAGDGGEELGKLRADLIEAERQIVALRQRSAEGGAAPDPRLDRAEARIAALEADLERANAAAEARLDQARADLAACRRRVQELEEAAAPPPAPAVAAPPPAPMALAAEVAPEPEPDFTFSPLARYSPDALEAAVMAAGDGVRPPALEAPEGDPDDLKAIAGVGPAIETWLHEHGIFHFRQIAALQASGLAWLARNLPNFGSRVYRENWVDQAARLARGEALDDIASYADGKRR